jgi:glycosyltransferase involved in cell wall biosynthesis
VAFAAALEALIRDPARRRALGDAGQARLRAEFALEANLERLAGKFALGADAVARHEDRVLRTA